MTQQDKQIVKRGLSAVIGFAGIVGCLCCIAFRRFDFAWIFWLAGMAFAILGVETKDGK